ncbi:FHA domain-containing protein [Merismopedia glauca]|uniref:Peptide-binding protein n=1 Tax=Merismopedia glauca CCAP 1448/3 TaxID=1296344 RepID=A0A2T1C795_9CYAN|nr:FHA domain-containing protein [Merismopedia glauca]PSB04106.1 peptide-binding protein [Merismopedia glauca CCAP 1448/3]
MQIQLVWTDITTGKQFNPTLETPITLGKNFQGMPAEMSGKRVSRIVLSDPTVAGYHALIDESQGELLVINQNPNATTLINGVSLPSSTIVDGDRLQIGAFEIQVFLTATAPQNSGNTTQWKCDRNLGFLIPKPCGRTDPTGCPHCHGNPNQPDVYYERSYYPDYGNYNRGYWGHNYYSQRDYYSYNSNTGNVDFTEADANSVAMENDTDYELDMGAS